METPPLQSLQENGDECIPLLRPDDQLKGLPRICDRDAPFRQSFGRVRIKRKSCFEAKRLKFQDPFHSLVNKSTSWVLLFTGTLYLLAFLIFAGLYLAISHRCGLGLDNYTAAFYLSIETMSTIGYGVNGPGNSYFAECKEGTVVLTLQVLLSTLLDAFAIGVVFHRVARGQSRAVSIIFSDKAVIRRIRGRLYFMFQVCELRKHQPVEAHVRCYTVRHDRDASGRLYPFQSYNMRLQHPDDELGGMLMTSLPSLVVHRLDSWSPLVPPSFRQARRRAGEDSHNPSTTYTYPDVLQRECDTENGNREEKNPVHPTPILSNEDVLEHLISSRAEVEGIDAGTSYTMQARHSYRAEDIVFDSAFAPATREDVDGGCMVDFDAFHTLLPAPPTDEAEPMPSH